MTNVERQILINQVVIMSALMKMINDGDYDKDQVIKELGKCVELTYKIII